MLERLRHRLQTSAARAGRDGAARDHPACIPRHRRRRSGRLGPAAGRLAKLAPPAAGKTAWHLDTLLCFDGSDGQFSLAGLTSYNGLLHGSTFGGDHAACSPFDGGVLFRLHHETRRSACTGCWDTGIFGLGEQTNAAVLIAVRFVIERGYETFRRADARAFTNLRDALECAREGDGGFGGQGCAFGSQVLEFVGRELLL